MIELTKQNVDGQELILTIPGSVSEYNKNVLKQITDNIKIAPHYALVGIVTGISPISVFMNANAEASISITPILAKVGDTENSFVDNVGDVVIIDKSSLERGIHCRNSSKTSYGHFVKSVKRMVDDKADIQKIFSGENKDRYDKTCYVIEFKLVPISDIRGCYTYNKVDDVVFD